MYRSESDAGGAAAAAARRDKYLRPYRESRCGFWHLTSQPASVGAKTGGGPGCCLVLVLLPVIAIGALLFPWQRHERARRPQ